MPYLPARAVKKSVMLAYAVVVQGTLTDRWPSNTIDRTYTTYLYAGARQHICLNSTYGPRHSGTHPLHMIYRPYLEGTCLLYLPYLKMLFIPQFLTLQSSLLYMYVQYWHPPATYMAPRARGGGGGGGGVKKGTHGPRVPTESTGKYEYCTVYMPMYVLLTYARAAT